MRVILALSAVLLIAPLARGQVSNSPAIDVVFCIDCSGSMGGVIETAKQKVWAIVNEVAKVKPTPVLRIGLYGYGNGEGPFRKFELTSDLDEVYKNLMTFKDEGWGSEFVGLVIQRATNEMQWATGRDALKVIYVVGNETAKQGPVDFTSSAPAAIAEGIQINAIYCGDTDYASATPTWREVARLADGQYIEIAGSGGGLVINTPFDDELAKLNTQLNGTYLGYGRLAPAAVANQTLQDANSVRAAGGSNTVLAERAMAKASALYSNGSWDLVDASRQENFNLADMKEEELPKEVRDLEPAKRMEFIQAKAKERAELQTQIRELGEKRDAFVKQEIQSKGLSQEQALDQAIRRSIIDQAAKKGFKTE
jgi:hypothetical protein